MNPTPIYTEALREAKRRTRKNSPERAVLVEMDRRTAPKPGRSTGPSVHITAGPPAPGLGDCPGPTLADGIARLQLHQQVAR